MPEDVTGEIESDVGGAKSKAMEFLQKKIGPLKVWQIGLIGAGGLALAIYLLRSQSGTGNPSVASPTGGSGNGKGSAPSSILPDIPIPPNAVQNAGVPSTPQSVPGVPATAIDFSPLFTDAGAAAPLIGQQAGGTDGGLSHVAATASAQSPVPSAGAQLAAQGQSEIQSEGAGVPLDTTSWGPAQLTPPPPPPPAPTAPAQQTYRAGERSTEGAGVPATPPDTSTPEVNRTRGPQ